MTDQSVLDWISENRKALRKVGSSLYKLTTLTEIIAKQVASLEITVQQLQSRKLEGVLDMLHKDTELSPQGRVAAISVLTYLLEKPIRDAEELNRQEKG